MIDYLLTEEQEQVKKLEKEHRIIVRRWVESNKTELENPVFDETKTVFQNLDKFEQLEKEEITKIMQRLGYKKPKPSDYKGNESEFKVALRNYYDKGILMLPQIVWNSSAAVHFDTGSVFKKVV